MPAVERQRPARQPPRGRHWDGRFRDEWQRADRRNVGSKCLSSSPAPPAGSTPSRKCNVGSCLAKDVELIGRFVDLAHARKQNGRLAPENGLEFAFLLTELFGADSCAVRRSALMRWLPNSRQLLLALAAVLASLEWHSDTAQGQ